MWNLADHAGKRSLFSYRKYYPSSSKLYIQPLVLDFIQCSCKTYNEKWKSFLILFYRKDIFGTSLNNA